MVTKTCKLFLLLASNVLASKMVFKTGDCTYRRDVFSNFTMKAVDSNLHMDMMLVSTLTNGLKAHLSFEFRMSKAKAYQIVFQHNIDYCALLKGSQNSLYRRWFVSMLKVGNFTTSCPIQVGYYYVHGWHLDGSLVPSFLYLGDCRIGLTLFNGKYRKRNENPMLECTVEAILV